VYQAWTGAFGCKLDEMKYPLDSYPNLAQFFCRPLKDGARQVALNDLVSPADARVTVFGEWKDGDQIEQIKGMSYSVEKLLGERPRLSNPDNKVYYCVFYLAPGDYHRIHAPTDLNVSTQRHFAGEMFSVSPSFARYCPDLFVLNERVSLLGRWKHGFFSVVPVGAYNVGSIKLSHDESLATNVAGHIPGKTVQTTEFPAATPLSLTKGQEMARFELGSTVVLVFETNKASFEFAVQPGDRVQMGQALGTLVKTS